MPRIICVDPRGGNVSGIGPVFHTITVTAPKHSDLVGPRYWNQLHSYAWRIIDWDGDIAEIFYEEWLQRAAKEFGGCCNGSIERLRVIQPIGPGALESAFAFFRFGWAVHNTINRELGRDAFGFEAALNQWKPRE